MKRNAILDLIKWKNNPERKPLIIRGARQVGKTWLMKEFGQSCYERYVYFNFDEEDALKSIFEANKNPQRIIELLSLIAGEKILPEEQPQVLQRKSKPLPYHRSRQLAGNAAGTAQVLSGGHGEPARPLSTVFR